MWWFNGSAGRSHSSRGLLSELLMFSGIRLVTKRRDRKRRAFLITTYRYYILRKAFWRVYATTKVQFTWNQWISFRDLDGLTSRNQCCFFAIMPFLCRVRTLINSRGLINEKDFSLDWFKRWGNQSYDESSSLYNQNALRRI